MVAELARGGMGVVYRAQDARGRDVALKVLLPQRALEPRLRERFQRELTALTRLRHPHVVPLLASGEHQGAPWLALELVDGQTLEARLAAGPLPIHESLRITQQLSGALAYMHGCGILHRDLKPSNVLLRGPAAFLTDFGLVLDQAGDVSRLTQTGVFLGTPGYWAPELAQGNKAAIGPVTDVYGLGAVLYACLTGRPPVEAESLQQFLASAQFELSQAPHAQRAEVPAWLSALCMRCLEPDPGARPQSAEQVARALLTADALGPLPRARRTLRLAAAALVLVAAATGGVALYLRRDAPAAASHDPIHNLIARSRQADLAGDWAAVAALGGAAIACAPTRPEGWGLRGQARVKLRNYESALGDLNRALQLDPRVSESWAARGLARVRLGQSEAGIADLSRALELNSELHEVWTVRGFARLTLLRADEALADFVRALELEPRHALAWEGKGRAHMVLRQNQEALTAFDRALERNPRAASVHLGRASVYEALREAGPMREELERALELDPQNAELHMMLATLALSADDFERARRAVNRALELDPGQADWWLKRAQLRSVLGEPGVLSDLNRALELDPNQPVALRDRAVSHANHGQIREALADVNRALSLSTDQGLTQKLRNLRATLEGAQR